MNETFTVNHSLIPASVPVGTTLPNLPGSISSVARFRFVGRLLVQIGRLFATVAVPSRATSIMAAFMLLGLAAGAQAQVNLKLDKSIDNASPALGDVITYTVAVTNTGSATATSVVVSESMTVALSTYLSSTASVGTFAYTAGSATGSWTIGPVDPGQTVTLLITARVVGEGVSFNAAEVASMDGKDANSIPGNGSLVEDDYGNACFSVPLTWFAGDEYSVDKPVGFSAVTWLVNGNPISSSTTEGSVDASGNLIIRAAGVFSFTGTLNGCPVNNCCNVLVRPGVTASVGDYVFNDTDRSGTQSAGDSPLSGVTVTLYQNGSAVATTTTDMAGLYSFTGLTPGTSLSYAVGFTSPAGLSATTPNVGGSGLDSDVNPATGRTMNFTLTSGQSNTAIDAGFYQPATTGLGDYVFADKNRDGLQNEGDTPISGVVVTLYQNGSAVATTTSNASGFYSFTGLTPGVANEYAVGFTTPVGLTATAPLRGTNPLDDSDLDPLTSRTRSITLASGEFNVSLDAGYSIPTAGLGDYVFFDVNRDGIQGTDDFPLNNVTVTLHQNGSAVATTTTDGNGYYSFTGLEPGAALNYSVLFTTPVGLTATVANAGGGSSAGDSDANPLTGFSQSVTLASGEFNSTLDAGYIPVDDTAQDPFMAKLGDYVFYDANRNGIQDAGDTPMVGVLVTLFRNRSVVTTTRTDNNGAYSFRGLAPGSSNVYSVGFGRPAGLEASPVRVGLAGSDSDADPKTGRTGSYTLMSGENNTSVDAGFFQPTAGLGDYAFEDSNANGIRDAGDLPLPGVQVTLYVGTLLVATTTTDVNGAYSFTGLTPGTVYRVSFGKPAGFVPTMADAGSDDVNDSDADVLTGLTGTYSLSATEFKAGVDAGFYRLASIGDYVFNDADRSGTQSPGDTPLPGVTVTLYQNGSAVATTSTDPSGLYSFTGLLPGTANTYAVGFTTPTGLTITAARAGGADLDSDVNPATGRTMNFTLSSGESNTSVDAGFYQPVAGLGDYVFEDVNANGIRDAGDLPLPGVRVTLYIGASVVATTTSDANGAYSFTGLTPGTATSYAVGFGTPGGFVATVANAGSNDVNDSDADVLTGVTGTYSLSADEFNSTLDAGFYRLGSVGDYVFNDTDRNGTQSAGDSPLPGVTVTLYRNGSAVATTTTAMSGFYSFTGLTPGTANTYVVGFTAPVGLIATIPTVGGSDLDSDVNPATGRTAGFTLTSGQSNTTIDAGFYQPVGGLGDYVFEDSNANGIRDAGDVPMAGVTVTLYQNGSAVATTTTDATGLYSFTSLTPGTPYAVGFGKPAGFVGTLANAGGDDSNDSDADVLTGITTGTYSLSATEFKAGVSAGFYRLGSIGDYVFDDKDRSGTQSAGDAPLSGVVVTLYQNGSAVATTTTGASGLYSFTGLTPGTSLSYAVGFTSPTGLSATTPNVGASGLDSDVNPATGRSGSFTLSSGQSNTAVDAGFYQPTSTGLGAIGDYVFEDSNANGVRDAGDAPLSGVVVTLYQNGSAVATTTTDATGLYSFTGLTPGTSLSYAVGFGKPAGFVGTLANAGGDDATDSDADVLTGVTTGTYSLSATEFRAGVSAGFYRLGSIGDYVFDDKDRSGTQSAGDVPLSGVVVTLYQNGSAVATTTTDVAGLYSFTGLTPGVSLTYAVGFTPPTGLIATLLGVGGSGSDSDLNPATGRTLGFTLTSGQSNTAVDAGFYQPATTGLGAIGDYVWYDYNNDGQQGPTATEPGASGVVVQLFAATNLTTPLATTTTDGFGNYLFDNLPSGQYVVKFAAPAGSVFTTKNKTSVTPDLDSDVTVTDGLTDVITIDVTQPLSSTARVNRAIDAGIVPYGSIGNYVWRDTNGDGIQNDGNTGLANIVVELFGADNLNTALAEVMTDDTGYYLFDNLISGGYRVKFSLPAGDQFTKEGVGTDRDIDSDVGADGFARLITINTSLPLGDENRNNMSVDAGVQTQTTDCATPLTLLAGTTNMSLCVGGSTSVSAVAAAGSVISWYLDATAQVLSFTSVSGQLVTIDPTTNITYYARAETANGCKSTVRAVVILVNARPNTPSCLKEATVCQGQTFSLATVKLNNVPLPGSTMEWHTDISETSPLVTNLTAVGPGDYYFFERSKQGCYSYPAVLTVNGINCDCKNVAVISTTMTAGTVCEGGTITLMASVGGSATGVSWQAANPATAGLFTGANSLTATYLPSAADIAVGQVAFTAITSSPAGTDACTPARSTVLVVINKRPDLPIGVACEEEILCKGSTTKLFGFTTGAKINWYANGQLIGTTTNGKSLTITPLQSTTYLAEAVSAAGCTSPTMTSVVVTVKATCLADLAVVKSVLTEGPYKAGDMITYGITVTNNGPVSASAVSVADVLPASLAYIIATPSGSYNAATGIWTVGTMPNGSDRSLLVQARVRGGGPIVNTAVVNAANDDTDRLANNTATATIVVDECNTPAPAIACAVTALCQNDPAESTVLTARNCAGIIQWSNGMTGNRIEVVPVNTTTYSASCVVGVCVSGKSNLITVVVTNAPVPIILASADKACAGGVVSLTALGCSGGQVYWSDNRIGSVISMTVNAETTITAQCRINNCYSKSAQKIIYLGNDLPKPTVICSTTVACPGETVELTIENCTGTPIWSTGETTTNIYVRPTLDNSTYSVNCIDGACTSPRSDDYTIRVIPAAVPTVVASATSVCIGSVVSLTATGCAGTVTWSNNLTGSVISIKVTSTESLIAYCRVRSCTSDPSRSVTIQVGKPQAPTIRAIPNTAICAGDPVTLTVTEGCANGIVKWLPGNLTGNSITVTPMGNVDYTATCTVDECESAPSSIVKVIVKTTGTAPTVTASATSVCNGTNVTLTAANCTNGGVVNWSNGLTGTSVVVRPLAGANTFSATCKQAGVCSSPQSRIITINVTTTPAPTIVGSTSTICSGETVELTIQNCAGTPVWSTGTADNGRSTIRVSPMVTTSYSAVCAQGGCVSAGSPLYTITVVPIAAPTVTASKLEIGEGESVTLTATGCPGTVTWSNNRTGTSIEVTPSSAITYYTATCRYQNCTSDQSVAVMIRKGSPASCVAKAGTLLPVVTEVCAATMTTVTLAATDNGGRVVPQDYLIRYILTKGTDLVIQQTASIPAFTVRATDAGLYTIHTLIYNPATFDLSVVVPGTTTGTDVQNLIRTGNICADLDLAGARTSVRYAAPPTLAGPNQQSLCYGEVVSVTAQGCATGRVIWSNGAEGNVLTYTVIGDARYSAVCSADGCVSRQSALFDTYLTKPAVPTIGADRLTVCAGNPATLTAQGCQNGTYLWSTGATTSAIMVTPQMSTTYAVKCTIGTCQSEWSPATLVTVGQPEKPVVTVNNSTDDLTNCFGTAVTLTASGCPAGAPVIWSNNQTGGSITVNPAGTATYSARCRTSDDCRSQPSNAIVITVVAQPAAPKTIGLSNVCPLLSVNLDSAVGTVNTAGGSFEYYRTTTIDPANRLSNTNVTSSGTYYVVEKTVGGCYSEPAAIQVNIGGCSDIVPCGDNPVTADAGQDAAICAAKTYKLDGRATGANLTTQWTTSGSGTFDDAFKAAALYTPSAADVAAGTVTLTFSAKPGNAACPAKTDAMVLTLSGPKEQPTVAVIGNTQLCAGDSVTLQAPAGFAYLWSNRATTQQLVVKQSGAYSVQVLDQSGCSSVPSASVTISVAAPVAAPLVANLRNTCPATTVSLSTALSTPTVGSTYEFRLGESASSALMANPGMAGGGTYHVFERTANQCVSSPGRVIVTIIDCPVGGTKSADLALTKTVSNTAASTGEALTYTLKVTNNGPDKAYNADIRDVLPAGLDLVAASGPVSYSVSNGVITRRFDSLAVGASDSIVFVARLTQRGDVLNTASIIYSNVADPVAGNNTAAVRVSNNTPIRAGRLGLAKEVTGTPTFINDSTLAVSYRFRLTNYGDETLTQVGATDDLSSVFGAGAVQTALLETTDAVGGLRLNPAFTGSGANTQMLAAGSTLAAGQTATLDLRTTIRLSRADTVTRTFSNTATAMAMNSVSLVSDASVGGADADPDKDGDPTNNGGATLFTIEGNKPQGRQLGVSLAVASVAKQANGSYNVTYRVLVKNYGPANLMNVSLVDTLNTVFAGPTTYSLVSGPVVNAGSQLVISSDYNGADAPYYLNSWLSRLAAGKQDTIAYTVNVMPNGNNGPFYTSVTATAKPEGTTLSVSDRSNNGVVIVVEDNTKTPVRFDQPTSLLGLAKAVGRPVRVADGVWDVPYTINVSNLGDAGLTRVQVVDDLSKTFGSGAQVTSVTLTADAGLKVNAGYTGLGLLTNLLDTSASVLPARAIRYVQLRVRVDISKATSLSYTNRAFGSAMSGGVAVSDTSNTGTNVDPDNDLDPRNNNAGTPVMLSSPPGSPRIGVALMVADTARQANGSYNVTYRVLVKNYGSVPLSNVSLSDSLASVFNQSVGASFSVLGTPVVSVGSRLRINPGFNGSTDAVLVLADSMSRLAAGATDTLLVRINVLTDGQTGTFLSTVYGVAKAGPEVVRDVSTNGMNPDLNGNNNPNELSEREATPLNLPLSVQTLFIPEGFSPNGDGINDLFVITGTQGLTVTLAVYNRWGHRVYYGADYRNDWDGRPNTGAQVGNSDGLPVGTYFYVVKLSDGREYVRYMTINR